MPHLQQGAKVTGKKALQTGVNVAQDVLDGDNIKTAVTKLTKQALGLPAQNSLQGQSEAGKKTIKRKAQGSKFSSPPGKKAKNAFHTKMCFSRLQNSVRKPNFPRQKTRFPPKS